MADRCFWNVKIFFAESLESNKKSVLEKQSQSLFPITAIGYSAILHLHTYIFVLSWDYFLRVRSFLPFSYSIYVDLRWFFPLSRKSVISTVVQFLAPNRGKRYNDLFSNDSFLRCQTGMVMDPLLPIYTYEYALKITPRTLSRFRHFISPDCKRLSKPQSIAV